MHSHIGQRFWHTAIDEKCHSSPLESFITFPTSSKLDQWTDVNFRTLKAAVDRMSWWLESMPVADSGIRTICYIGPSDLRYYLCAVAAAKTRSKILFSSPRNSPDAHVALIEKCNCSILIGDERKMPKSLLGSSLTFLEMKPLEYWLSDAEALPYHSKQDFDKVKDEEFLILHTSGSTGLPKPIKITHRHVAASDLYQTLPLRHGQTVIHSLKGKRLFCALPPFHAAAINKFTFALLHGFRLVLPPPDQPPSTGLVEKILDLDAVDCAMITPSVLADISQSPAMLRKLKKLDWVMYGGSPLSKSVGDILCRHSRLLSGVGSTEGGFYLSYLPEASEDWEYLHYHESMGIAFNEADSPGDASREAVITRTNDLHVQHAFITFPDQETFSTNDLYEQHPSKKHLWRYAGRKDDVIVLSNGEKLMPTDMEGIISSHPHVSAALIAGQGRFQPLLIVEEQPGDEKWPIATRIEVIWPTVISANEQAPGHGKIDKSHIMFLTEGQAFKRSNKGLISRALSIRELQHQIDEFYARADEQPELELLDCTSPDALGNDLIRYIKCLIPDIPASMSLDEDLFSLGLDSLQIVQLARTLKQSFKLSAKHNHPPISPSLIYSNPSVLKIVRCLFKSGDTISTTYERGAPNSLNPRDLLLKFAKDMNEEPSPKATVILTGSTGNFGSYILSSLLQNANVSKIFCLNRSEDAKGRQKASFQHRGLPGNFDSDRVEFIQVKLHSPHFCLPIATYNQLLAQTTHIVHNAWPVNFNQSVASFEPHIRGCMNLVKFSRMSVLGAHIFFISSIATARRWDISSIPEHPILDLNVAEPMGYGQAKLISEILLYKASLDYGIQTTICRVGQIAGPVMRESGEWNRNEWFPSLIKSSLFLGMLPQDLPGSENIDWIPVDILADITVDLLFASAPPDGLQASLNAKTRVFHAVNPASTHWSKLLPIIAASMPDVRIVQYEEWLSELRRSEESLDLFCYEKNPAIKLLGYFNSLAVDMAIPVFDTMQTCVASKTLRNLPAVQQDWVARWMEQWGF